jgi:glutathione S-transferase
MEAPDFARISPRRKIPILEDGDLVMGESAAIPLHLAERYRERGDFLPRAGTTARAIHDDLCLFVMTEMDAILYVIRRHEGLPDIYGASDVACDAAKAYFIRSSHECERRLSDGRPFLTGDDFKVADLLFKTCLDWASALAIPVAPSIQDYSQRIAQRSAYKKGMDRNFPPSIQNA